jgi:guanylate kinase
MEPTKKLPLFIFTGASCVGKSVTAEVLFKNETDEFR